MANIKETWVFSSLFKEWYFHILYMLRKDEWTVDVFKEQMDDLVGLGRAVPQEEIRREISSTC